MAAINSGIVFLDSGIGGLPYLQCLCKKHPQWPVSYVADTAHFPYGELTENQLIDTVLSTSRRIFQSLRPELMVIACNSASVTALEQLRKISPCPVIGTVPAIKTASNLPNSKSLGILATEATIDSTYIDNLVKNFASHKEVIKVAAGDIVRFVEEKWLINQNLVQARKIIEPAIRKLLNKKVDSIILACTHFIHVHNLISDIAGPETPLIDTRDGVVRRIIELFQNNHPSKQSYIPQLYITENRSDNSYGKFITEKYNLQWCGVLS